MSNKQDSNNSYKMPIILAVVAVCFYVLSIVMQYINNGAVS